MLRKALLGLIVALSTLGAAEAALRAVYSVDALLFEWERPSGLLAPSTVATPVTRPGASAEREDGPYRWRAALNALGLREDREIPREEPGVYRILAIGDSWIFGYSVDQGKTIADVLERLLPEKLGVARVEVVNAGVFGAGAFDMLVRYRLLVDSHAFDGVLLGRPHNARRAEETVYERNAWYRQAREGPASHARLYLLARRWMAPFRSGLYAEPPTGEALQREYMDVRTLARDARSRGLAVWFTEFPDNFGKDRGRFEGNLEWRAALAGVEVHYGGHGLEERACWGFNDLAHPSEAGAYAIAARMAEVIAKGESVPVGGTPACSEVDAVGPGKPGWAWR